MKLNNKGFAISTVMYMILIMAVILITLTLTLLSSRKLMLDKSKQEAEDNIYNIEKLSYREVLKILESEVIEYYKDNTVENGIVKVDDVSSSVDIKLLDEYKLTEKSFIVTYNNNVYNAVLQK